MTRSARITGTLVSRIVGEALLVVVGGLLVGLAANAISPRGLDPGRDYFPPGSGDNNARTGSGPPGLEARLREHGLQPLGQAEARAWFDSPDHAIERVVFVDVRSDAAYAEGHVPAAYHFDYYHPAQGLPEVLAACRTALKAVVYCRGGECEDAELAAKLLEQSGVPPQRMWILVGGFVEWKERGGPVETGTRGSGAGTGGAR